MKRFAGLFAVLVAMALGGLVLADSFKVDPVHSGVMFRIKHANASWNYGRFNDPSGTFEVDPADLEKMKLDIEIKVDNVDTHNEKRDAHLKSPDFFNAKQFPTITFKSTSVKKVDENRVEITGDLTLRGVTKSVVARGSYVGSSEFPKGTKRAGLEAQFTIKRSDFDMKGMMEALGDDVTIMVGLEGVKS